MERQTILDWFKDYVKTEDGEWAAMDYVVCNDSLDEKSNMVTFNNLKQKHKSELITVILSVEDMRYFSKEVLQQLSSEALAAVLMTLDLFDKSDCVTHTIMSMENNKYVPIFMEHIENMDLVSLKLLQADFQSGKNI